MTLIIAVTSPETIWLLADRRLTFSGVRRQPRDDARKVMCLSTTDGVALLGYAGLGRTVAGTEPADWMSAVLRGRNLPLERSLEVLASAFQREFPRHLLRLPGPTAVHNVFIPAFLNGSACLYSIDLLCEPDRKSVLFRYTRHIHTPRAGHIVAPRFAVAGSSQFKLEREKVWRRELLRLVHASDRQAVSPGAVADYLAMVNHKVHQTDSAVGPRCFVVWRNRTGGIHGGGGAHIAYSDSIRELDSPAIPTIATGIDVAALVSAIRPLDLTRLMQGQPLDTTEHDREQRAAWARLPTGPDESLR